MKSSATFKTVTETLVARLQGLHFGPPVSHVYNPLVYASATYTTYWERYGRGSKEVLLLGMNPGPWGMAQTGIPFGDVEMVKGWLQIRGPIRSPAAMHPKRPVLGFDCPRSEVSGRRLWGWAQRRFGTPGRFFKRFWVGNYCPLVFMEASGRNRTPDKLPKNEKAPLMAACDEALRRTVTLLRPNFVVGVGRFAAERARKALGDMDLRLGWITHPSPANPKANQGWEAAVEKELMDLGIRMP